MHLTNEKHGLPLFQIDTINVSSVFPIFFPCPHIYEDPVCHDVWDRSIESGAYRVECIRNARNQENADDRGNECARNIR
jgi:hypothetical protein